MPENVLRRLRAWFKRARTAPALAHQVADVQRDQLQDLRAVAVEVSVLVERVARLEKTMLDELARMRETTAAVARETATQQLFDTAGEQRRLRPGLSILTISWNHAGFLPDSVRSGLAALDLLPPDEQGVVLVLDDSSTDETPQVLEQLRTADDRVRSVRSPVILGPSRAKNVLLHVVETTHAFMLDADNAAVPEGVIDVYKVATEWDAAFAYGNVIMVAPDGSTVAVASNEPPTIEYFFAGGPHIDTLGVLDVAYLRQVGGYSTDPAFHAFDDHEMIHRLARLGALIAFVPTVASRYRVDQLSYSQTQPASHEAAIARLRRAYNQDGRLTSQPPSAMAAHPATGPLWATPAARAARPQLEALLAQPVEAPQ